MENGFRDGEIVQVQGREFPVVGGRLRLIHELNGDQLSIETQIVDHQAEVSAVVTARVTTKGGVFTGTGASSSSRDPKLVDALLELAETRAVARALRYAGIGVEFCGYEELGPRDLEPRDPLPIKDSNLVRMKGLEPSRGCPH